MNQNNGLHLLVTSPGNYLLIFVKLIDQIYCLNTGRSEISQTSNKVMTKILVCLDLSLLTDGFEGGSVNDGEDAIKLKFN